MADTGPVIVSASLNADLPAAHGDWFARRLEAGSCRIGRRAGLDWRRVRLDRAAVAGFVFWTRDVAPFMPRLARLRDEGHAFVVQFAITGYPGRRDPAPVPWRSAVASLRALAAEHGPGSGVWRYDPILLDARLGADWHAEHFACIAAAAAGATDEVVLAFACPTRVRRGATAAAGPSDEARRALVRRLVPIARAHGMRLTLCAQPDWLAPGAAPARCIDARRLADRGAGPLEIPTAGFVSGCLCARAVDLGDSEGATARFAGAVPARKREPPRDPGQDMLVEPRTRFERGEVPF